MARQNQANDKFEKALEELERVVEELECGDLSLEEALAAFEKGVGLVKQCNQKLNEVEKKLELLVKDKGGRLKLQSVEEVSEEEAAKTDDPI